MTETTFTPFDPPRRFHFDWIFPALFRPRPTFARIVEQANGVWLTPLLILTGLMFLRVIVAALVSQNAGPGGPTSLPPGFEFWSPEQQQQFFQGQQSSSGMNNVLQAVGGFFGVWLSWLITFGLLHLILTLLGGRGSTRSAMNVAAWASLPFAVRDLVRIVAMLIVRSPIARPGLSGFTPAEGEGLILFLTHFLEQIDVYLIWHVLLLLLGAIAAEKLSGVKALSGVMVTIVIVLVLQALPGFIGDQLLRLMSVGP